MLPLLPGHVESLPGWTQGLELLPDADCSNLPSIWQGRR
jgi:hypothetical protein